jgi:hypothetical protein
MANYRVTCFGEARAVYIVEADSEEEAMSNWQDGRMLYVDDPDNLEAFSAELEEE